MAKAREILGFLLFLPCLAHSKEAKTPEPIFRQQGGDIEMGYCFGVDYISVYRSGPDGDQLLGTSSDEGVPLSPPKDYQGRINITNRPPLLGLQISQLRHSDSGLYRRECWKGEERVDQHQSMLSVCEQEVTAQEVSTTADGGAVLLCNASLTGHGKVTIQWYHEVFPNYKAIMFLNSNVSLEPLQEELRGLVEVSEGGASLRVTAGMLKSSHHFYCLVMKGERCLSFYNTYLPEADEISMYVSEGERVVLTCPSGHKGQGLRWETPLGHVNTTRKSQPEGDDRGDQMYAVGGSESGDYSLVIPVASNTSSGLYSCFSPALVAEFSLLVCPAQERRRTLFSGGGEAVLECKTTQEEAKGVQWYHHRAKRQNQLIVDSKDKSVALPEYLSGRVTFSVSDSSLRLTKLSQEDAGEYFCVVLTTLEESLVEDDYPGSNDDDDEENTGEYHYDYWDESDRCISKQETSLQMNPEPESPSNTIVYAGCAVGGLVLLGVLIAVVVVLKKRATDTVL